MIDFKEKSKNKYDTILTKNKTKNTSSNSRISSIDANEVISYSVGHKINSRYRKRNIKASIKINNG